MAAQAINELKNAGFSSNQIHYFGPGGAGGSSGNFFDDLKSWFTGQEAPSSSVTNNLTDMGISGDEAQYYANEYKSGHPIVVVNTRDHQQEAMNILYKNGAYDYRTNSNAVGTSSAQQPSTYVQSDSYVPPAGNPPLNQPVNQPATQSQPSQQATSAARADELQELQAQLQATQTQLRDAQAQLQAARERESQLQATRQRESQLQAMRRQLQETQAQLQATQAELRATQERIAKANPS
jgi:tRNA U34 5-carboxymethylaminomethyl modifying GTPase MnmE/TrmE